MQKIHTISDRAEAEKERNSSRLGCMPDIKRIFVLH